MVDGAYFNVLDYGAVGDGVADDRTAINLAFQACFDAGGGTIFFPAGTYYISDYIGNTDYAGNTQTINISVLGESGTVINCNPSVYGNNALYLRFQDAPIIIVKNLYINCNTKVASGIRCSSVTAIQIAEVDSCEVWNCHGIDNALVTTSVSPIFISSSAWSYTASVTNCVVQNVTRDKTGLACQAIVVTDFASAYVANNSIKDVKHDGTDRADADGIVVFSNQTSSNYQKSVATIINNHIRNCEGRFIKLQTNGSALVQGNYMSLAGSLDLIDNWRGVDSQVGDATITNNTIRIGTGWTGGTSSTMFTMQPPTLANQDYSNEAFFQRVISNNVEVQQKIQYFCIPSMPDAGVTANHYVEIANNIANFPTSLNTATQADVAFDYFIYNSSGPSVANTNGQVVWRIYGNTVFSYNFIALTYTQADYTDKWYFYIYDNFKPSIGYTRELFTSGATSPYTNTCMIRDNKIGESAGQVSWPLDLSKILDGSDWYSGSQTLTNVPASYTFSRIYKKGYMLGVQRSTQYYISSNTGATWTALA